MAPLTGQDALPHEVRRYLAPGERIVLITHHHWARMLKPVLTVLGALILWLLLEANLTMRTASLGPAMRIGMGLLGLWLAWRFLDWRHDWIVVTDKRLLRRHGIVVQHVPMMPFTKVTDMSYERSVAGRLFGFGRFVMESAGQEQALRVINWVPDPDQTYRIMCAEIFHVEPVAESDADTGELVGFDDEGPDPTTPGGEGGQGGSSAAYPDVPDVHNPISQRLDSYSRAMPIHPPRDDGPVYESDDLRKRRRGTRTGPMPFHPPS